MARYFESKEIGQHRAELVESISKPSYFDRSGRIKEYVARRFSRDSKILDIGSGAAHLPHSLREIGFGNIQLVDIDDYSQSDFVIHKVDVSNEPLPLSENSIDVVTAVTIFEHLENPLHCIREIRRVLKTGGCLFVSLPSIHSLRSRLKFLFRGELQSYSAANNHISIFTDALISKFFQGFDLLETHYGDPYFKILGKRVSLPEVRPLDKLFSNNVLYVFRKNGS